MKQLYHWGWKPRILQLPDTIVALALLGIYKIYTFWTDSSFDIITAGYMFLGFSVVTFMIFSTTHPIGKSYDEVIELVDRYSLKNPWLILFWVPIILFIGFLFIL